MPLCKCFIGLRQTILKPKPFTWKSYENKDLLRQTSLNDPRYEGAFAAATFVWSNSSSRNAWASSQLPRCTIYETNTVHKEKNTKGRKARDFKINLKVSLQRFERPNSRNPERAESGSQSEQKTDPRPMTLYDIGVLKFKMTRICLSAERKQHQQHFCLTANI